MSMQGIWVQLQEGITGTVGKTVISCSLITPIQMMCAILSVSFSTVLPF